ncbi:hypothetical protein B566_EDAN014488 [Ephemera danica]|nr:hypothetical protein B566_EDAN014488 [Ephemera danica]
MSVNVNRNVSDPFYRYKMPRLMAKVEGKGNGIKTVIVNMVEVAKALSRPPTYPTKYFGCELGAQTQFDFKNDRYIVNGSHDASKLQDLLDGFIRRYVLCPACDNPETTLTIHQKKGTISQSCKACGAHGLIEFNHKVNTYIIKNPPELNPAVQGSSITEGKRARRSKKQQDDGRSSPPEKNGCNGDDTLEDAGEEEGEEDEYWSKELSENEAPVVVNKQELTEGLKSLTITEELELSEKERMDLFYEELKRCRDAGTLDNKHKELVAMADRLEIRSKVPLVLVELLFDQNIAQQAPKHRLLFLRFTLNDTKAQKYLMGGIEQVIALHKETLLPRVPHILKLLYEQDILEESVLLEWSEKVSKKYVTKELSEEIHKMAQPLIKWLREAEEEESSEEEDTEDDELEIEYNDRASSNKLTKVQQPPPSKAATANEDAEGGDIDIDAI